MTPRTIERTYVVLTFLQTAAGSLVWGINTLFLLDAGLSLTAAFVANAAFTAGMVLFEVPTGVVADTFGRRTSFILGAATLLVTTLLYLWLWWAAAALGWWMVVSALLGLGFTFFSGATEAWLVDALQATGYTGTIDAVLGKGQVAAGVAMLGGTIGGGLLGQINLGVPYALRSVLLVVLIVAAAAFMHDIGFTPERGGSLALRLRGTMQASLQHAFRPRPVRLLMFAAPFSGGVGIWAFYAFQPYALKLLGDPDATWVSGVAAAVFACGQMIGGASVTLLRRWVRARTTVLIGEAALSSLALVVVGLATRLEPPVGFWVALAALAVWSLGFAASEPIEQAYLNASIPSQQRATVVSMASLMQSLGGVFVQPSLGRLADVHSLGIAYGVGGLVMALRLPFLVELRRLKLPADVIPAAES